MILFFDTSVLIPAFQQSHVHHEASNLALARVGHNAAVCGAHSLTEFYAVMTWLPRPYRLEPDQALLCIEQIAQHVQVIALQAQEYLSEARHAAAGKVTGGRFYDALLLACARKASPDRILTWNKHRFTALAPDLADRIVTP
ncbi:MAG: PIN domain-containing protein [Acidobacteriaceae bacterium]